MLTRAMLAYGWPGNVRELANAIEHAIVLGTGPLVEATDLPSRLTGEALLTLSENLTYRDAVNAARKEIVVKALRKTNGNRAGAARLLALETKYFLQLIKSLGVA